MYDHEVQGNTIVKPLAGRGSVGPADASVLAPGHNSKRGIAVACGLQTPALAIPANNGDPYQMALAAH
jgi:phosphoribosylformylglycinamidine (FGAM) synthase-like enzyme